MTHAIASSAPLLNTNAIAAWLTEPRSSVRRPVCVSHLTLTANR